MLLKLYQLTFITFLILGTLIAVSSNSWFTCWIGLEMNLMSMIPLIFIEMNKNSTETVIKYFLIQALASILLILTSSIELFNMSNFNNNSLNMILSLSMAIKMGAAPFHFWFPQVMKNLNYLQCATLMIWQKLAPMFLMSYFFNKPFTMFLIISSALVGALGGLNQINMKMIFTYSSITHLSWMIMLISISINYFIMYYVIYTIMVGSVIIIINSTKIFLINELKNRTLFISTLISISMMSLGGLPPFLGFAAKMTAILMSIPFYSIFIILMLVMSSLTSLLYYFKIIFNFSLKNTDNINLISQYTNNPLLFSGAPLIILGNIIFPMLVLLT